MTGIVLALTATILLAFADAGKKHLVDRFGSSFTIVATYCVGAIVFLPALVIFERPILNWEILAWIIPVSVVVGIAMEVLYLQALKAGDLSLSLPFRSFAPVYAMLFGNFFLNEDVNLWGMLGLGITVSGTYIMFLEYERNTFWEPLVKLLFAPGPRLMLLASAGFPLVACLQRIGASASSSIFYVSLTLVIQALIYFTFSAVKEMALRKHLCTAPVVVIATSIVWASAILLVYLAVEHTLIVNVTLVLQLQPILAIPIAKYWLKEDLAEQRLLPSFLIVVGVMACLLAN
jgi:drug/metabolite transporter (DMT)-like permease